MIVYININVIEINVKVVDAKLGGMMMRSFQFAKSVGQSENNPEYLIGLDSHLHDKSINIVL